MSTEQAIEAFWNAHPCGEHLLADKKADYEDFFATYDQLRYQLERHIPRCLDEIGFSDKDTVEIGLGQGTDSEQIIRRGARWSGLDLTQESVDRVRTRLALRSLPFKAIEKGSVLAMPFADRSFDIVFSHGVLHHVPDILRAQAEIARVLRPGGRLVAMLYAKWSVNYLVSIAMLRRAGLLAMHVAGVKPSGIYGEHLEQARRIGIRRYLRMDEFIHRNTDGPHNPFSRVYDRRLVEKHFPAFSIERMHREFMHAPPLPVHRIPGGRKLGLGWHLWVHMVLR